MQIAEEQGLDESVPALSPFPKGVPKRLIDLGTMHYEASIAGFEERYRRGETPQTIHVWWARRPHRAMRALSFACLCLEQGEDAFDCMMNLTLESMPRPLFLDAARKMVGASERKGRLLDMFGGGGTIGYEGALLGAETYSVDSNEMSVFIQRCLLVHSQSEGVEALAEHVARSGKRVLEQLATETANLFPLRGRAFGYLWTYSIECPKCAYRFLLSKRPWVSKKRGKRLALVISDEAERQVVRLDDVGSDFSQKTVWVGRNGTVRCPRCNATFKGISIKSTRDELVALAANGEARGKTFSDDVSGAMPTEGSIAKYEREILSSLSAILPSSTLPRWSGIVNPALYGIETHAEFLGSRQRAVLLGLIRCLAQEYETLKTEAGEATARATTCLLAGMVDQLVDWNCRLSMWISQNEQVGRAFSGPGVAMLWDYVETDPVMGGPANLWKKLDRIVAGTKSLLELGAKAHVERAYAQDLPYDDEFFDAIVTDPPYYDNIYYNVLADFFFAWKRVLFQSIEPDLFRPQRTDDTRELVASTFRSGDAHAAHRDYCDQLGRAIMQAERVLRRDGVFSLVYSHSSLRGWEAVVRAYRPTGLRITSVQPLSIERKARPRAMMSDAVNTCVVFVAHRGCVEKDSVPLDSLAERLRKHVESLTANLSRAGWQNADIGIAAFAQGVGMLGNVSGVGGCESDVDALRHFEGIVQAYVPEFRVVDRKPL